MILGLGIGLDFLSTSAVVVIPPGAGEVNVDTGSLEMNQDTGTQEINAN